MFITVNVKNIVDGGFAPLKEFNVTSYFYDPVKLLEYHYFWE